MAHPIFFVWKSADPDALRNTGIGALAPRWKAFSFGPYHLGVMHAGDAGIRPLLNALHTNLVVLPGPNSSLTAVHAQALIAVFPLVKIGDPVRTILTVLYTATGDEDMNPNNY